MPSASVPEASHDFLNRLTAHRRKGTLPNGPYLAIQVGWAE